MGVAKYRWRSDVNCGLVGGCRFGVAHWPSSKTAILTLINDCTTTHYHHFHETACSDWLFNSRCQGSLQFCVQYGHPLNHIMVQALIWNSHYHATYSHICRCFLSKASEPVSTKVKHQGSTHATVVCTLLYASMLLLGIGHSAWLLRVEEEQCLEEKLRTCWDFAMLGCLVGWLVSCDWLRLWLVIPFVLSLKNENWVMLRELEAALRRAFVQRRVVSPAWAVILMVTAASWVNG